MSRTRTGNGSGSADVQSLRVSRGVTSSAARSIGTVNSYPGATHTMSDGSAAVASWATQVRPALTRWATFTVLFAVTPLAFAYFASAALQAPLNLTEFLAQGELLLLAATVSFGSLGELVARKDLVASQTVQLIFIGCTALLGFLDTLIFSLVFSARALGETTDSQLIAAASMAMFPLSLLCSSCCIAIANHRTKHRMDLL